MLTKLFFQVSASLSSEVLRVLELSLVEIFRSIFEKGFATVPPSYCGYPISGSCSTSGLLEESIIVSASGLHHREDHYLMRPETFLKILISRLRVQIQSKCPSCEL